jgi:hypothetical protein
MRFLRVRFKVRQVMVGVALLAVLLAPVMWRRDYCLRMATRHAREEARARSEMRSARTVGAQQIALITAIQHGWLRSRYQRVATRPWESLPDDPADTPCYGSISDAGREASALVKEFQNQERNR